MNQLGLKQGTVEVVTHNPEWLIIFENERQSLARLLGTTAADIQHVGSTAITELDAKPIIDIAVGVNKWADVNDAVIKLTAADWIDIGWMIELSANQENGDYLLVKELQSGVRSHHLHVVQVGSTQWDNFILFRDALNCAPELRERYAQLKNRLAVEFANDRNAYTAAKEDFITRVIAEQRRTSA